MKKYFDEVVWSQESDEDLDYIHKHYLNHSPETAQNRIINIILEAEKIVFLEQYQIDEYNPEFRRYFVDNKKFRLLYKVIDNKILIVRIYPNSKYPIKNKFNR